MFSTRARPKPLSRLGVAFIGAGLILMASAATASAGVMPQTGHGNNGTIKIHEQGTPSGTESNDPKVCVFNVEGFSFDAGQTGYLVFTVQGGDGPHGTNAGPFNFGPTNANGYYATEYFNLKPGHYKGTLYGKMLPSGKLTDEKAKSKVFKVTCAVTPSPSPTPTSPSPTPTSPTPTPTSPSPTPTSPTPTPTSPTPTPSGGTTTSTPSPSHSSTSPATHPASSTPSPSTTELAHTGGSSFPVGLYLFAGVAAILAGLTLVRYPHLITRGRRE